MIAIKGMEMPRCCISCPLYVGKIGEGYCAITHKWNAVGGINRLDDCPLVEIVTCKDCKKLNECFSAMSDRWFCPLGERKE